MKTAAVGLALVMVSACEASADRHEASVKAPAASAVPAAPSGAPSAVPAPAHPDVVPARERAPADLIRRLTGFPEQLIATEVAKLPGELVQGKLLWGQAYRTVDGFEAFVVYVCDGPCELPVIQRLKAMKSPTPMVETRVVTLPGSRPLEADLSPGGLGGAMVFSSAPGPGARFTVVTLFGLPPHDVAMSDATRAFFRACAPLALSLQLGEGLDAALFPR